MGDKGLLRVYGGVVIFEVVLAVAYLGVLAYIGYSVMCNSKVKSKIKS